MTKKRAITEQDKINLAKGKKFTSEYQPNIENVKKAQAEAREKKKEIEKSADILNRLLQKTITNKNTGEEITQKEAMLYGLLVKAIKENDLKAIELVLKLIGDFDNKLTVTGDIGIQKLEVSKEDINIVLNRTKDLADEG